MLDRLHEGKKPGSLGPPERAVQFGWWIEGPSSLHNARTVAALVVLQAICNGMASIVTDEPQKPQLVVKGKAEAPDGIQGETIGIKLWCRPRGKLLPDSLEIPAPLSLEFAEVIDRLVGYPGDAWPTE